MFSQNTTSMSYEMSLCLTFGIRIMLLSLKSVFKADHVEYTLIPVSSKDEMRLAYEDHRHTVSSARDNKQGFLIHSCVVVHFL